MYENISLGLSILALIVSFIALYNSWKARTFEEKEKKTEKIAQDLEMYTDIAYSNQWNWLPQDVGINDPRYSDYSEVIKRFVNYLEFVDPKIKEPYRYVIIKFNSGYKNDERTEIWKKYEEIRDFSKKKAEELGKKLR